MLSQVLTEVKKRLCSALAKDPQTAYDLEETLLAAHDAFGGEGVPFGHVVSGWMEKTPQSKSGLASVTLLSTADRWQRRFFVLSRVSHVRCVLSYYKTDAEYKTHPEKFKGRMVLIPTATVRRVARDSFTVASEEFRLTVRAGSMRDADTWIAALVRKGSLRGGCCCCARGLE